MWKKLILFALIWLACVGCFYCAVAQAADATIEVEYTYPAQAQSYNLYMDGTKICSTIQGPKSHMTCANVVIPYGVHEFTMTAVNLNGVESNKSPAYSWAYVPDVTVSPVFVSLSVIVDGKTIPLEPVKLVQEKTVIQPTTLTVKQKEKK